MIDRYNCIDHLHHLLWPFQVPVGKMMVCRLKRINNYRNDSFQHYSMWSLKQLQFKYVKLIFPLLDSSFPIVFYWPFSWSYWVRFYRDLACFTRTCPCGGYYYLRDTLICIDWLINWLTDWLISGTFLCTVQVRSFYRWSCTTDGRSPLCSVGQY